MKKFQLILVFVIIAIPLISQKTIDTKIYYPCNNDTLDLDLWRAPLIYLPLGDTVNIRFPDEKICFLIPEGTTSSFFERDECEIFGTGSIFQISIEDLYYFGDEEDEYYDCTDRQVTVISLDCSYFSLGNDRVLPIGEELTLYGPKYYRNFTWSTGEETDSIIINQTGYYSVIGEDYCGDIYYDTILVKHTANEMEFYAGMMNENYNYTDVLSILVYPLGYDDPYSSSNSLMYLDVNNDSITDFGIRTNTSYGNGGGAAYMIIQCHNDAQIARNYSDSYIRIYNQYELINIEDNWESNNPYFTRYHYTDCVTNVEEGMWADSELKYLACRVFAGTDTTYAYLRLNVFEDNRYIYYYIEETSHNGILVINDVLENETEIFSVYPNPVQDVLSLDFNEENSIDYKISDLYGQVFYQVKSSSSRASIDVSDLSSGIYIIEVLSRSNCLRTKFIKQ